jgi:spiro-SPASM protein
MENKNDLFLSLEDVRGIINFTNTGFSDTAVALGGLGEPLEHKSIDEILDFILSQKSVPMVIVETNGKYLEKIFPLFQHSGCEKLRVIININSIRNYENLHGVSLSDRQTVFKNIDVLCAELEKTNPALKKNIYVQTLKIVDNERELDEIFDFTDQKGISFLLQKYNSFIGMMPEKRVSDMTPLDRSFCWHLRRDIFVRAGGDVVFCKQDVRNNRIRGNIRTTPFTQILDSLKTDWENNYKKIYPGFPDCESCDEYYTFNM